jgi:general secretion pathway protein J
MRNGFTLVEMLVALFVFAMVSAGGVAMLRFSVDNQNIVRDRTERFGQLQTARAILKTDISQAAAFEPGGLLTLTRRGWENPDGLSRPSMQHVVYLVTGGRLERRAGPALSGAETGAPQVLIEGLRSARIEEIAGNPKALRLVLDIEGIGRIDQLFLGAGA